MPDASDITSLYRLQRALVSDSKRGSSMQSSVVIPKRYSILPNLFSKNGVSSVKQQVVNKFRSISTATDPNNLLWKLQEICRQTGKFGFFVIKADEQRAQGVLTYTGNFYNIPLDLPAKTDITYPNFDAEDISNYLILNREPFYPKESVLSTTTNTELFTEYITNGKQYVITGPVGILSSVTILLLDEWPSVEL